MRHTLVYFMATIIPVLGYCQHGFPEGHWCNTEEGWNTKVCRALWGLKNDEKDKVITIPHRGIWGQPGEPEDCLLSVENAYNEGYMFAEIDVVLTADRKLVLCHDQQSNRMTSLPATFSADGNLFDNGSFFRSLNWGSPTLKSVPNTIGLNYTSFSAIETSFYKDRFDNVTTHRINLFEDILKYIKGKEIIITLDIKTGSLADPVVKDEYFDAILLCLEAAEKTQQLHQIVFKPGSAGQVRVDDLREFLTSRNQWDNYSKKTNVTLINIIGGSFPMATNRQYLDNWYNLPSLVAVEQIYKTYDDKLLTPNPDFDNKSILKYTQDKGFRTGVFHPIPTDIYGAPGGRGNYFNPRNFGDLNDFRGSLEFLFGIPDVKRPGIIVTDRPDVDRQFLMLFELESKYTLRDNPF